MKRPVAEGTRSYTAAYGDGQTHERTSADVDSGRRSPSVAGPSVLRSAERHPRRGRLRPVRGGAVSVVLRAEMGRPSLPPGRCFRLLLLGYFEGIKHPEAAAHPRGRLQPRPPHAAGVRARHAARAARTRTRARLA